MEDLICRVKYLQATELHLDRGLKRLSLFTFPYLRRDHNRQTWIPLHILCLSFRTSYPVEPQTCCIPPPLWSDTRELGSISSRTILKESYINLKTYIFKKTASALSVRCDHAAATLSKMFMVRYFSGTTGHLQGCLRNRDLLRC